MSAITDTLREVTIYGGVIAYVYWPWSREGTYEWRTDTDISWHPSQPMIRVAWFALKALVSAAILVAIHSFHEEPISVAIFTLAVVGVALNKLWVLVVGDWDQTPWGVPVLVLASAAAIANSVLQGVAGLWVAFGLYLPYTLWVTGAVYFNARFAWVLREPMTYRARLRFTRTSFTKR